MERLAEAIKTNLVALEIKHTSGRSVDEIVKDGQRLTPEQLQIFEEINKLPAGMPVGLRAGDILSRIAKRPDSEVEDYLQYIRERMNLSYAQIAAFRREIRAIAEANRKQAIQIAVRQEVQISDADKKEALAFLNNLNLLDVFADEYLPLLGLVGEKENAVICFLGSVTRFMEDQCHILINGLPGSGKSMIMNTIASLTPEESLLEISSSSAQAFNYMTEDLLDRKLVTIAELDGANENDQAMLSLRLMLSERKLTRIVAGRNQDTGRMETVSSSKKVRSCFLITSNLLPSEIEQQSLSRMLVLYSAEDISQSERVQDSILLQQTRHWKKENQRRDLIRKLLKNAQRLLEYDLHVEISYAPLLRFPANSTASRRSLKLFLSLLKAIAFVRQKTKTIHKDEEGQRWVSCDVEDYRYAFKFLNKTLSASLSDLDLRSRNCLRVACLLEFEKTRIQQGRKDWTFVELQEKAKRLGVDLVNKKAARDTLYSLVNEEYIVCTEGGVGQQGKKSFFKVSTQYSVDEATNEVQELNLLGNQIMTPEELQEAVAQHGDLQTTDNQPFQEK